MKPQPAELAQHLAFEIHWLVYAAHRFRITRGRDRVALQDSALLHARNLLEFAGPGRPRHAWWVADLGGTAPPTDGGTQRWLDLINSKVAHLGQGRTKAKQPPWPVPEDDERCAELARFVLHRVVVAARGSRDRRMIACRRIARLGLSHLEDPGGDALAQLARLT
jgi:hypothetical protein